jgi:hypothetical protein
MLKAAIAATAINAAITAYSIAVTPDLSLRSFVKSARNRSLLSFDFDARKSCKKRL